MLTCYLPRAARHADSKFHPRHFIQMQDMFGEPGRWIRHPNFIPREDWAMVLRAPGVHSFTRELSSAKQPGIYLFDKFTKLELAALEKKNGKLIIDFGWEILFPRAEVVEGLKQSLAERGIDPARVIILQSNQAAAAAFAKLWGDAPAPRILEFPISLSLCVGHHRSPPDREALRTRLEALKAGLPDRLRPRHFNTFNGRARNHRFYIVAFLAAEGLLPRGYVSLLGYGGLGGEGALAETAATLRRQLAGLPFFEAVGPAIEPFLAQLPLSLDLDAHKISQSNNVIEQFAWESQNPEYYDNSYVSFVSDTLFHDPDTLFITEKPLKPIMNASPFLYFGNSGALAELRRLGFETFHPLIDETYDEVANSRARLGRGLEEARRLAAMPLEELRALSIAAWPKIEHNYWWFWNTLHARLSEEFRARVLRQI